MFSRSAELYDLIYREFKDYRAEAARLAEILGRLAPEARTVLDVACATGEHVRWLGVDHGYEGSGLDAEPDFVQLARSKYPEGRFWQGDMTSFELDTAFDVITCLFGSIAYAREIDAAEETLRRIHHHLAPGGVALVEPWLTPDAWRPGRVSVLSAASEELNVVRMAHSGELSPAPDLQFHYLVGGTAGIEHRVEHHRLGLFTTDELLAAFHRAGFSDVEHDPEGLTGRGLFIAR